jgi:hypothetical protein
MVQAQAQAQNVMPAVAAAFARKFRLVVIVGHPRYFWAA